MSIPKYPPVWVCFGLLGSLCRSSEEMKKEEFYLQLKEASGFDRWTRDDVKILRGRQRWFVLIGG